MSKMKIKNDKVREFMGERLYEEIVGRYPESTQLILQGRYDEFEEKFPQVRADLVSCKSKAQGRNLYDYALNLMNAWILEDFTRVILNDYIKLPVSLGGTDDERRIKSYGEVRSDSDLTVELTTGEIVNIELMADYTSYANKSNHFHLRKGKLPNLLAEENKTLLLFIDLPKREFFLQDVEHFNAIPAFSWRTPVDQIEVEFPILAMNQSNVYDYFNSQTVN